MKEIATMIMEVSIDTGYPFEFLCECVEDLVKDGESYHDAVSHISDVAHEHDF